MARAGGDDRRDDTLGSPVFSATEWPIGAAGVWPPMLGVLQLWNSNLGAAITAFQLEWLDFVSQRLKEDVKLPRCLAGCKSTDEFHHTFTDFCQKAASDYHAEISELVRLSTSGADKSIGALQRSVEMATRDARSAM